MHQDRRTSDDRTRRTPPPAPGRAVTRTGIEALQATAGNQAVQRRLDQARDAGGHEEHAAHQLHLINRALASPPTPIEDSERAHLEAFHGADLSTVAVHTGRDAEISAAAIGARAYAVEEHVVLGAGGHDAATIAHETSHVLDSRAGRTRGTDTGGGFSMSRPGEPGERAADATGHRYERWRRAGGSGERTTGAAPADVHGAVGHVDVHRAVGGVGASSLLVQRADAPSGASAAETTTAPGSDEEFEATLTACSAAERVLSLKYRTRIGPAPGATPSVHFSSAMLERIDAALSRLPASDVRDNPALIALEVDTSPDGSASAYDFGSGAIGFVRPRLLPGFRAPQRLYAAMNTDSGWQRSLMDRGALASLPGVGPEQDRGAGIDPGSREVMSPQGNLVKWTTRHEVGHAVDNNAEVVGRFSGREEFGGWQIHRSAADRDAIAEMVLERAGFDASRLPRPDAAVSTLTALLQADSVRDAANAPRRENYFERYRPHFTDPAEFEQRKRTALALVAKLAGAPWSLPDDQVEQMSRAGRVYHLSQYGRWVSYSLAQRRQYKLSNYQFSDPAEWFAEVYAHYYNDKKPEAREKIHPTVREWLETRTTPEPA